MSKRRTFTPSFKAQVVLEVLAGGHDESEKRIYELERMVGRLTMKL